MKVACYADDPREPDLIGDVEVDLTEVLTKGETDGAFNIMILELGGFRLIKTSHRMVHTHQQGQVRWKGVFRANFLVKCSSLFAQHIFVLSDYATYLGATT